MFETKRAPPWLIGDFDWKSIPARAVQNRDFREVFFVFLTKKGDLLTGTSPPGSPFQPPHRGANFFGRNFSWPDRPLFHIHDIRFYKLPSHPSFWRFHVLDLEKPVNDRDSILIRRFDHDHWFTTKMTETIRNLTASWPDEHVKRPFLAYFWPFIGNFVEKSL